MRQVELIRESLSKSFPVTEWGEGVRVVTHSIYPSNGLVEVVVRGGTQTFVVSDEGNAFRELVAAGVELQKPDKLVRHLVSEKGLLINEGVISSPPVKADSVGIAIAFVASASKEVAEWLFAHSRIKKERDFRVVVHQFLKAQFNDYVRNEVLVGASNKRHKFENIIVLKGGKKLIVDPVVHDANSINARVVANFDVRTAAYDGLEQRIVYDDDEEWKPDELNLLQVGAPVVPFSRAGQVFARLSNG